MNMSQSIGELAAALVAAQANIEGAVKDKTNPHFRSKYADLSSVVDAIKKPLNDAGLSYTQVMHDADNAAKVETVILHKSGEWMSCGVISVPVSKHDAQGYGSALTYARRYSLSAAFGVAPEDDDGNAASKAAPEKGLPTGPITPTTGARDAMNPEQMKRIEKVASEVIDCFEVNAIGSAYDVLEEAKFDADEKVALWTFFDSKMRSALKREAKARQDAKNAETATA